MSGLEAIGAAAAILQVAETGLKLSQSIYEYVGKAKTADVRLSHFAQDVQRTSEIVHSVADLLSEDQTRERLAPKGIQTANSCVKDCKNAFDDIEKCIDGMSKRSKWTFPYREFKLNLLDVRLEKLKSNLSLILIVLKRSEELKNAVAQADDPSTRNQQVLKEFREAETAVRIATHQYERAAVSVASDPCRSESSIETSIVPQLTQEWQADEDTNKLSGSMNGLLTRQETRDQESENRTMNISTASASISSLHASSSFGHKLAPAPSKAFIVPQIAGSAASSSRNSSIDHVASSTILRPLDSKNVIRDLPTYLPQSHTQFTDTLGVRRPAETRRSSAVPPLDSQSGAQVQQPRWDSGRDERYYKRMKDDENKKSWQSQPGLSSLHKIEFNEETQDLRRSLENFLHHIDALQMSLRLCSRDRLTDIEVLGLKAATQQSQDRLEHFLGTLEDHEDESSKTLSTSRYRHVDRFRKKLPMRDYESTSESDSETESVSSTYERSRYALNPRHGHQEKLGEDVELSVKGKIRIPRSPRSPPVRSRPKSRSPILKGRPFRADVSAAITKATREFQVSPRGSQAMHRSGPDYDARHQNSIVAVGEASAEARSGVLRLKGHREDLRHSMDNNEKCGLTSFDDDVQVDRNDSAAIMRAVHSRPVAQQGFDPPGQIRRRRDEHVPAQREKMSHIKTYSWSKRPVSPKVGFVHRTKSSISPERALPPPVVENRMSTIPGPYVDPPESVRAYFAELVLEHSIAERHELFRILSDLALSGYRLRKTVIDIDSSTDRWDCRYHQRTKQRREAQFSELEWQVVQRTEKPAGAKLLELLPDPALGEWIVLQNYLWHTIRHTNAEATSVPNRQKRTLLNSPPANYYPLPYRHNNPPTSVQLGPQVPLASELQRSMQAPASPSRATEQIGSRSPSDKSADDQEKPLEKSSVIVEIAEKLLREWTTVYEQ